jgi:hypothetical protein
VQEHEEEEEEGARKRHAANSPARGKSPAGSKSPAKPRSTKKSKFGGKTMTEANRTASPLSTADEFYIISACFGEVHGKVPAEQELAKITELYTTYYMLNTFRWRHPELGPLFASAPGMNGHMNRLTLDLPGGAPTTEYVRQALTCNAHNYRVENPAPTDMPSQQAYGAAPSPTTSHVVALATAAALQADTLRTIMPLSIEDTMATATTGTGTTTGLTKAAATLYLSDMHATIRATATASSTTASTKLWLSTFDTRLRAKGHAGWKNRTVTELIAQIVTYIRREGLGVVRGKYVPLLRQQHQAAGSKAKAKQVHR